MTIVDPAALGWPLEKRYVRPDGPYQGFTEEENFVMAVADTLLDRIDDPAAHLARLVAQAVDLHDRLPSIPAGENCRRGSDWRSYKPDH